MKLTAIKHALRHPFRLTQVAGLDRVGLHELRLAEATSAHACLASGVLLVTFPYFSTTSFGICIEMRLDHIWHEHMTKTMPIPPWSTHAVPKVRLHEAQGDVTTWPLIAETASAITYCEGIHPSVC